MPPRKSTSSMPATDNEDPGSPTSAAAASAQVTEQQAKSQSDGISVEDLLLPRAVTQRLAKSVLPPDTAIQKDALLAIQKAATVFISYLSSHANEATLKRTLAPSDVLNALSELEFDSLRPQLERELDAHTEALADKKKAQKDRKAATTSDTQAEAKDGGEAGGVVPAAAGEEKDATAAGTSTSSVIKGNKRIKRDSAGNEKHSPDETEVDEDETEEEEEAEPEPEPEPEEEDDDEEVEEEDEDNDTQEVEDLDRVEDLDGKMQADYDDSGSDDDDNGPAAQLRGFG